MIGNRLLRLWALVLSLVVPLSATATEVGRLKLDHPALGTTGGSSLHSAIEGLWTRVSDNLGSRYFEYTGKANSSVTTIEHNLGALVDDLRVTLYTGTGATKVRVVDPALTGYTIAGTSGFTKTKIDVTAPAAGGPHSFTVVIQDSAGRQPSMLLSELSAAPATPSSGVVALYAKSSDKKLYTKDSTGTEFQVGASGSGEVNALSTGSTDATGWTAETGMAVATTSDTAKAPLYPAIPTGIRVTPTSGTLSVYKDFVMPAALKQRKLKIEWHQLPESGYASGDLKVQMLACTDSGRSSCSTLPLSSDVSSVSAIPNVTAKYSTSFDADGTTYYRMKLVRVSGTTPINFTSVIVGPGIQPQGAVVGEWQSYTPTTANVGSKVFTNSAKWRRVGDSMEVAFNLVGNSTAAGAGSSSVTFSLPSGYTIDSTKLADGSLGGNSSVGHVEVYGILASTQYDRLWSVITSASTTLRFILPATGRSFQTADLNVANAVELYGKAVIPIAEWAGSGTVNLAQNDVQFAADDGSADVFGPDGALVPNQSATTGLTSRAFSFTGSKQAGDQYLLEVNYRGNGWSSAADVFPSFQGNNASSSNYYGVSGYWTSSTVFTVYFGNQGTAVSASNASAGGASWATEYSNGTRFRVRKASGGQAVGFGLADISNSGLVSMTTQEFAGEKRLQVNTSGTCGTSGNVCSGTWTPAVQSQTNMDTTATFSNPTFSRVGSQVNWSFMMQYDPSTASTNASVAISGLPGISTNFANAYGVKGACVSNPANGVKPTIFFVQSVSSQQRMAIYTTYVESTTSQELYCSGQYTAN